MRIRVRLTNGHGIDVEHSDELAATQLRRRIIRDPASVDVPAVAPDSFRTALTPLEVGRPYMIGFIERAQSDEPFFGLALQRYDPTRPGKFRIEIQDQFGYVEERSADFGACRAPIRDDSEEVLERRRQPVWTPRTPGIFTLTLTYDTRGCDDGSLQPGLWRAQPLIVSATDPRTGFDRRGCPVFQRKGWFAVDELSNRLHLALFDLGYRNICVSVQAEQSTLMTQVRIGYDQPDTMSGRTAQREVERTAMLLVPNLGRDQISARPRWEDRGRRGLPDP